jgi:hypothetical protein
MQDDFQKKKIRKINKNYYLILLLKYTNKQTNKKNDKYEYFKRK